MILLTTGDSWTQGDADSQELNWEAKPNLDWYNIIPNFGESTSPCDDRVTYKFYDSNIWPKVLGKKLGWETWNCGRSGASISRIVDATFNSIEYLHSIGKKDIFVVIQLTSNIRYRNMNVKNNSINFEGCGKLDTSGAKLKRLSELNIKEVVFLQSFLKQNNIPYLMYNGFDEKLLEDWLECDSFQYLDSSYIYNNIWSPMFKKHIEQWSGDEWTTNGEYFQACHPTDISHEEWANQLYKYIRENYEFF
tara:strand:- start:249 stop:995 length:747 start_codon:yes stop_codon:yes gene_type:complete